MKFFYKGQLVRTSKTRNYTHAIIREKADGTPVVYCCSSTLDGAAKQLNTARGLNPTYKIVELECR